MLILSLRIIQLMLTEREEKVMSNAEIKRLLKNNNIYMWEVAKKLGIHETTFGKWFREPLSKDHQMQILSAVESIRLSRKKEEN